jgi:hypothetical protein
MRECRFFNLLEINCLRDYYLFNIPLELHPLWVQGYMLAHFYVFLVIGGLSTQNIGQIII